MGVVLISELWLELWSGSEMRFDKNFLVCISILGGVYFGHLRGGLNDPTLNACKIEVGGIYSVSNRSCGSIVNVILHTCLHRVIKYKCRVQF